MQCRPWTLIKETVAAWLADFAPSMGAALSYYTVFSLAPMLLIVIAVAGMVFGEDAARGAVFGQLSGLMGADAARAVEGLLADVGKPKQGALATMLGLIILLVGATTVFAELQGALDRIWRAPDRSNSGGVWGLLRARFLSFSMVLGIAFLLIVSLVISAAVSALGKWWGPLFGGWEVLVQALTFVFDLTVSALGFAMIYKLMPRVKVQWRDVWIGAAVTAVLFALGKFLIGLYIGKSGIASSFGAAGSLVVILVWVYYSAQIFLLGAEFTWVFAGACGSRKALPAGRPASGVPNSKEKDMLTTRLATPTGMLATDIPAPQPDVVPLPPSPHPVPPPPATPPEVQDPVLPGQNEPVRDPVPPEAASAHSMLRRAMI